MSGFGMIVEDPFYDEDGVLVDEDFDVQGKELAKIVDGWIRESVAKKQQSEGEFSPYVTINS